jgi:hypothetical protein
MKSTNNVFLPGWKTAGALVGLMGATFTSHAAITGQWDFDSGDLSATIGQPIEYLDGPFGTTQENTEFGTTTSFGIPDIDGSPAQVMKFPASLQDFQGFNVPNGASPNGGGIYINQYTIVMDVLFPESSSGVKRALVQTDSNADTDLSIGANNGIGATTYAGSVTPNTWHRIAFSVDQSANVISKFIDGVKVADETIGQSVDGRWALESFFFLFQDDNGESAEGYINSLQFRDEKLVDGLIAALGGPSADGILTGPPPNPFVISITPTPEPSRTPRPSNVGPQPLIEVTLQDGETSVDTATIELRLDGELVTADVNRTGQTTTISYIPEDFLAPLSGHTVNLSYKDNGSPASDLGVQWQFSITDYQGIPSGIAKPVSSASSPGFIVRTAQAPEDADIRNDLRRAQRQLDGVLLDPAGNPVPDISIAGSGPGGSYQVDTINFSGDGVTFGNFGIDQLFPGLPGTEGTTRKTAVEVVTFIELDKGFHRMGINVHTDLPDQNDDDGFQVWVGGDARDAFAQVIGSFQRTRLGFTRGDNDTIFNFVAPESGLYSFRVLYYSGSNDGAALEWFTEDPITGDRYLINGNEPQALNAFQQSSEVSLPYVKEALPQPGTEGVSPEDPIQVTIIDDSIALNPASVQLSLNGSAVTPTVEKVGNRTTVTFQPDTNVSRQVTYTVDLTYAGTNGSEASYSWEFTVDARNEIKVTGQWDFRNGLAATIGAPLEYFDGPNGTTAAETEFGTTTEFGIPDINGLPATVMKTPGGGSNNFGYLMRHGVQPNGGGSKANQYTLVMDVYWDNKGPGFASIVNLDDPTNQNDGDSFIRFNDGGWGQGGNGYEPDNPEVKIEFQKWQRLVIAADLSADPPQFVKYIDGVRHSNQGDRGVIGGLDGRQTMGEIALLFADNDGERGLAYVSSVQVRDGQMSEEEVAALGAPSSSGVQLPSSVRGSWTFENGLSASIGSDLQYFDGPDGTTAAETQFGMASEFGVPGILGQDVPVMKTPAGNSNNFGYLVNHGIQPNGGGSKVNQYTLILDVYWSSKGPGFSSVANLDDPTNQNDGDSFIRWNDNGWGQGGNGYEPDQPSVKVEFERWHRLVISADLSKDPPEFIKYIDGRRHSNQGDRGTIGGLDGRQTLAEQILLFADNDGERSEAIVSAVQVRDVQLTPGEVFALGGASPEGIPLDIPENSVRGQWNFRDGNLSAELGMPLEYFDGPEGTTAAGTEFGSTTDFGIPAIDGGEAMVMKVPTGGSNNLGYLMRPGIAPNGGGSKVNQYTLIMDIYWYDRGPGFASIVNLDDPTNQNDGDSFIRFNDGGWGQGGNGYEPDNAETKVEFEKWQRYVIAADFSADPPQFIKYIDGVRHSNQGDRGTIAGLDGRQTFGDVFALFADNDGERGGAYVSSIQIRDMQLTAEQIAELGAPTAPGIPAHPFPGNPPADPITITSIGISGTDVVLEWIGGAPPFQVEMRENLGTSVWSSVGSPIEARTLTVPASGGSGYFRVSELPRP